MKRFQVWLEDAANTLQQAPRGDRRLKASNRVNAKRQHTQVIEKMERETGIEPATFSLGIWYAIENKHQMRPRLCILTTANHREIKACTEKPENGVNGVKSRASLSTPLRYHSDPPLDRLIRAVFDSDKGNPCHVQIQSPNTDIVHPEVWRGSGRCWRIFTPTTSFRSVECAKSSPSSVSG